MGKGFEHRDGGYKYRVKCENCGYEEDYYIDVKPGEFSQFHTYVVDNHWDRMDNCTECGCVTRQKLIAHEKEIV